MDRTVIVNQLKPIRCAYKDKNARRPSDHGGDVIRAIRFCTETKPISLLTVCKKINSDCIDILYGKNGFQLFVTRWEDEAVFDFFSDAFSCFSVPNRQKMRHLKLSFEGGEFGFHQSVCTNSWPPVLQDRQTLRILAVSRVEERSMFRRQCEQGHSMNFLGAAQISQDLMMDWRYELVTWLEYILRGTSSKLLIDADHQFDAETQELFQRCLGRRYRETQFCDGEGNCKCVCMFCD